MRFIIDNPNDAIQNYLMRGSWYDEDNLKLIKKYCPPSAVIIDVGANVGNHTVYFSKNLDAKTIYVIEPVPTAYKLLLCNIALNYCHNVNVDHIGLALGDRECAGYPYTAYGRDNLGSTRMFPVERPMDFIEAYRGVFKEEPMQHPTVQIVRGDSLFADEHIDFIKIDVEGMEIVCLEGFKETIRRSRPKIFIEIAQGNLTEFHAWLQSNDYQIIEKCENIHYNPNDPSSAENYMVIPR